MACSCHTKSGTGVKKVSPFDQCSTCAKKHIVKAWTMWNEFTYTEDNRDFITGNLRLATDHLMYEHRETALMARNLAVLIEENRDGEIGDGWDELLNAVRNDFRADHPDAAERLEELRLNAPRPTSP